LISFIMCMHVEPSGHKLNKTKMILVSSSMILVGGIIGISCARAVPSSSIMEASLGVSVLLLFLYFARREKGRYLAEEESFVDSRCIGAKMSSDADSLSTLGSEGSRAEPPSPKCVPSDGTPLCEASSPEPGDSLSKGPPRQISMESPPTATSISIHIRVEQEKRRLSRKGCEEPVGAKATAHCLRFQDAEGKNIRYMVRSSKKRTSATVLERLVEGKSPKKVKSIVYDDASRAIHDGKNRFLVPSSDVAIVMKSLNLLCKVASVKLDVQLHYNSSPGLRKVLSNIDLMNGSTTSRKMLSTNSLSQLSMQ